MACKILPSEENLSDSDLETGLPSPDESDTEQNAATYFGVTVPHFCNKLREQTKPLLNLTYGIPSLSKHLGEPTNEKSKESKAKKRVFKGKQQPSSGVIERRYGYIPNPRWPKTFTYSRPYEPVGVGDKDREGVPGVVFRERRKLKSQEFEHSYQESDFPVLNMPTSDRSQVCNTSPSVHHSSRLEDSPVTSATACQSEPQLINTSSQMSCTKMASQFVDSHESPSTSTPIKQGHLISQSTPRSAVESIDSSVYTSDSADSTHSSFKSCILPGTRCKKLSTVSPGNKSSSFSFQADDSDDSPHLNNSRQDSSLSGMVNRNSTWSHKVKLESEANVNDSNSFPPLHTLNTSQISPAPAGLPLPVENHFPYKHSVTSTVEVKPVAVTSNSVWSHITRGPGQKDQKVSPKPLSPGQLTSQSEKSGHLSASNGTINLSSEQPDQCESGKPQKDRGTRNKNRRFKTPDKSSNEDMTNRKHPPLNVSNEGSQSKLYSNSRGSSRNSNINPRVLTLENFITPQKNMRKKNGASKNKNDYDLLQSRFVEQLSANPISPPKKVRPSPIKKLSFSKQEEVLDCDKHIVSDSGDNRKLNVRHSACRELQNLKPFTEMTIDDCGNKPNTEQLNIKTRSKVQPIQNQVDSNGQVFSLERSLNKEIQKTKDVFEEEDEHDDIYPEDKDDSEAKIFWKLKSVKRRELSQTSSIKFKISQEPSDEDSGDIACCISKTRTQKSGWKHQVLQASSEETADCEKAIEASLSEVMHKSVLKKYARRYCHFIEEHQVPNLSVELFFIIQLLTCTDVDMDMLQFLDRNGKTTYFRSVHNGVYFAVTVIKRLRRLFLALDKMYLELLAACPRIEAFSPKLHKIFVQAAQNKVREQVVSAHIEHTTFNPQENGTLSFPDTNNAHVFKCQRDNFYAFYRHYHDTSSVYEFRIENQIQYVYDGCTAEQNSVVNLMHLAELYLSHMILCCAKQSEDKVDVLKMIQAKGHDEKLFTSLYEAFSETSGSCPCPPPGFSERQMFFKDFVETLSCPAFNEHLRNLVVLKILELNSTDFSSLLNLHSPATVLDDKTPLRAAKFTEAVKILCVLGKLLGYLTFSPYMSGTQSVLHDQTSMLLTMRELSPIPVPMLLLLKQAFDEGHLCLTVPWIVEYLAMMDQMAPQLSVYRSLLKKLHFIQSYAWTALYKSGHQFSGLLIVSCISWLFETPAVPEGFFFSCDDAEEISRLTNNSHSFDIDRQKLVSQHLLSWCCPYLEQGQILLTQFLLKQLTASTKRSVLPVSQPKCSSRKAISTTKFRKEVKEIEKWLGTSFVQDSVSENKKHSSIIDDEVVPAYVLTRLLARKETDELEDLEVHLLQSSTFLKASVDTTVDLMCAKMTDLTCRMVLKLLVFEAKTEVRKLFQGAFAGNESDAIRDTVLSQVNMIANRYSIRAKESFYTLCERIIDKELPDLLFFLTSNAEEDVGQSIVHIARKLVIRRLQEWADIQLEPALFRRTITREADKCAKAASKHLSLYPNDYSKKLEDLSSPDLHPGFIEQEQLSELIDKALSYGVWYINALSPGIRPDDVHMVQLIEDFTNCVTKKMVTMDFAFSVMTNFLMHLIIQYIVDAPQNWTKQAEDAFVRLCCLCRERKVENSKISVRLSESMKKKKLMKVKVINFLSVYTLQWLDKSEHQLETKMAYCKLIYRLVTAELLQVETVYRKLTHSRENRHLDTRIKIMVNKMLIKILEMLYENETQDNKSYSSERVVTLVSDLAKPLQNIPEEVWDDVLSDLSVCVQSTFGCVLNLSNNC